MNWEAIGVVAEIVGAVAVVASQGKAQGKGVRFIFQVKGARSLVV
jgi:hypothetical protein